MAAWAHFFVRGPFDVDGATIQNRHQVSTVVGEFGCFFLGIQVGWEGWITLAGVCGFG